jgi:drug/metabolite transporter (DMT)-like permease
VSVRIRERAQVEGAVLAVVICVAWAGTFIAQRYALEELPPGWVAALRLAVATLVLLPFARGIRRFGRRELWLVLVLGLLNQVGFVGMQIYGLNTIGAGPTAAIIYLQPVLVVLAAATVLGERLTHRRVAGAALGFAGVAIVSFHQAATANTGGVLLLLGAAISWAAGTIVASAVRLPVLPAVTAQHVLGAVVMLSVAGLTEHLPTPSGEAISGLLFAAVAGSAVGWLILGRLLERDEAGAVTTRLFTVPVLAAVLGVLLLAEPVTLALAAGIVLVGAAVRLTV